VTKLRVKELMSGDPVSIRVGASALEALDLLAKHGIRHLPVVDREGRVVGVLSQTDLRAALFIEQGRPTPQERALAREWSVGELMTHAPETAHADEDLSDAADRMADLRIGCLPIVDAEQRLEGILSETDALHALATMSRCADIERRRAHSDDLDTLVTQLRAERERIAQRLDSLHADERALSRLPHEEPADDAERAADLRGVDLAERVDALAVQRLEAIDRALDHAEQGRLSICDDCGGAIPVARLRALPGTTRCVDCARSAEGAFEPEVPFERVPGGRAETGRPELGARVYTRFGEGRLLRIAPFGSCPRCGDVEGVPAEDESGIACGQPSCRQPLDGVVERAIVALGEREVYVDPVELRSVDPAPYT